LDRPLAAQVYRCLKIAAIALITTQVTCVDQKLPTFSEPDVSSEVLTSSSITHTRLTSGNNANNRSSYTTASISPAPNTLITLAVLM